MVNYYRDMWKRCSHILAPLSKLAGSTTKWQWTTIEQKAFEDVKRMVAQEAILAYPDFSQEFHIYADASDYQLGGVIMQNDHPLAFYTRKLNKAQAKYPTGEQELLSIVETIRSFDNILRGQRIVVHTDHLNLLYRKLASNRLIRWRMILEEYGPEVVHVKGESNVVADALSRLDMEAKPEDELPDEEEDQKLQYAYVKTKDMDLEQFPMSPRLLQQQQQKDKKLQSEVKADVKKDKYSHEYVEGYELIHSEGKICVPVALQARILAWYHEYLAHPGQTRMEQTIHNIFHWKGLRKDVQQYCKTCKVCQMCKKQRKKYGHLPAKEAETELWSRVNVDMIGPYSVKTPSKTLQLRAMTMIDPASNWFEIAALPEGKAPSSDLCQRILDDMWLARYPRPMEVGFDNRSEFKALFRELCANMGMKPKPTTAYNPQGNSILERAHQVLGNCLRTFQLEERELEEDRPFDEFLTATAYALRSTYHTTLGASPGQAVFGRDMILPIKFKTDWALIEQRKQKSIDQSNANENKKRIKHDYQVGDKVLLHKTGILSKLTIPYKGPYEVVQVHTNGTVVIQKGVVRERVNIRRIVPFHEGH